MKICSKCKGETLPRLKYVFELCGIVQGLAGALSVLTDFKEMAGVLCIKYDML